MFYKIPTDLAAVVASVGGMLLFLCRGAEGAARQRGSFVSLGLVWHH